MSAAMAAKMVADSTQSDLPEKLAAKRKKTTDKKKTKKKRLSERKTKKKSGEDEYDEHDLDLDTDINPLDRYIGNRSQLIEEMFHCVQGTSLQRTLPDILKELSLPELKQRCLEQLEVMSKKRIKRIIAGDDPGTISSSGTEDDSSDEENQPDAGTQEGPARTPDPTQGETTEPGHIEGGENMAADSTSQPADSPCSDRDLQSESAGDSEGKSPADSPWGSPEGDSVSRSAHSPTPIEDSEARETGPVEQESGEDLASDDKTPENQGEIMEEGEFSDRGGYSGEEDDASSNEEEKGEARDVSITERVCSEVEEATRAAPAQSLAPVLTQNQMELLELEMRARAIKAMLNSNR